MRDVTLNQQEQARIQVLNSVLEYQLPIAQAAEIMGVSERHTKRLLAGYRKDGPAALAHGNRGRKPQNAVPETAAAAVVKLASNGYAGANHSHFTELLREREGINLSRPTVRRILAKAGIGSPRSRRSPQHRFRRRRMPQEGMLVQIDGSQHPWLEDRGPRFRPAAGRGRRHRHRGPGSLPHHRRHPRLPGAPGGPDPAVGNPPGPLQRPPRRFQIQRPSEAGAGRNTQFANVIRELGIQQIFALSPQAKGRVERMAETFQDRLVTELRLAGASTMDQAKEVLREFCPGSTPGSPPRRSTLRRLTARCQLNCLSPRRSASKHTRKVARDNTVKYHWTVLQLFPGADRPSYAGLRVDVLERADGELMIRYHGETVDFQEAPPPSSALWGLAGPCSPGPELQQIANVPANGHLNEAQRKLLASLDSADEEGDQCKRCSRQGWGR